MPAHVLARHYRPRQFSALVGQAHVTQALGNALASGRLHHAYLFTGTRGVGKTTVSRILAKALNCTGADGLGGVTREPCGVCPACRDIDAGRFVDYIELDAASNRGVDEISALLDQAVYKPVVGRTKVYMIDEVHMLSAHAFNAMLKTLEEPPEYLKFVLATTDPQKVPVTVLSRCLQFNLRPLPPALVQQHLGEVLAQEAIAAEPAALRLLARAARGSMRDALSLTDQAIAFGAGTLTESGVQQMLGSTPRAQVLALLDALAAHDAAGLVAGVQGLQSAGHSGAGALDEFTRWLQLIALAQAAPESLEATDPDTAEALARAGALATDALHVSYALALQGRAELPLASDEYAGLTMLMLRLLALQPGAPAAAASRAPLRRSAPAQVRVAVPVPAPVSAPAPRAAREPAAPMPAPPDPVAADEAPPWLDLPPEDAALPLSSAPQALPAPVEAGAPVLQPTPEGEAWAALLPQLGATALARTLALQAQCLLLERDSGAWRVRLRVPSDALKGGPGVAKLQALLAERAGGRAQLEIEVGAVLDSPFLREQASAQAAQVAAEAALEASPELAALRRHFPSTRIVPGSIRPAQESAP